MSEQILDGVKILDISCVVAAPTAAALLAEFGADVIKVEIPEGKPGDGIRERKTGNLGIALHPKLLNRNKRCITLDFHEEEATEIFYELAKWADVIIANFRPPTLKRFHIDYDDVVKYNPQIIYMAFSAYGRTGPNAEKPGYARAMESYAGLTYINGYPDNEPLFSGTWIADGIGGMYAAYMIALALFHKERTGEGQLLDLGLYEPVFRMLDDIPINYDITGNIRKRHGNEHVYSAPNSLYKTKDDRYVAIPVNSGPMFERFCHAIGREDILTENNLNNVSERYKKRQELNEIARQWCHAHNLDDIVQTLENANVAVSPVNSIEDIFKDRHIWERGSLVNVYDEDFGKEITVNGICGVFSKTPGRIRWNGRARGADNDDVYRNILNFSDEKIAELKKRGVI